MPQSQMNRGREDDRCKAVLMGDSPGMARVHRVIASLAGSAAPVLIEGEPGSGKEAVALAVHRTGPRRIRPLVRVACDASVPSELERRLFGPEPDGGPGALARSSGGDLLLSEIGALPPALQTKLLVLLEGCGLDGPCADSTALDLRIIATCSRDLPALARQGRFRSDLLYRVRVVPIRVPPLRRRREDIAPVARALLAELAARSGRDAPELSREAAGLLAAHTWPGNLSELDLVLGRALERCPGPVLESGHLPPELRGGGQPRDDQAQRRELLEALALAGGNRTKAARFLGVSRVTVHKRIKRLGIDVDKDI